MESESSCNVDDDDDGGAALKYEWALAVSGPEEAQ